MSISPPSINLAEPNTITFPRNSILHRVHDCDFAGNSFNPTSRVLSRFSPIFDKAGNVIPVLYTADSLDAAMYESIFHDILAHSQVKEISFDKIYEKIILF